MVKEIFSEDWDLSCQDIFENENKCKQAKLKTAGQSQNKETGDRTSIASSEIHASWFKSYLCHLYDSGQVTQALWAFSLSSSVKWEYW